MSTWRDKYWALLAQANHLRSPDRRDGPSTEEAEEAACRLEREANELSEAMFYGANTKLTQPGGQS